MAFMKDILSPPSQIGEAKVHAAHRPASRLPPRLRALRIRIGDPQPPAYFETCFIMTFFHAVAGGEPESFCVSSLMLSILNLVPGGSSHSFSESPLIEMAPMSHALVTLASMNTLTVASSGGAVSPSPLSNPRATTGSVDMLAKAS